MTASHKHFVGSPASLVLESLQGLCSANAHVKLDSANKVVYSARLDRSKVALICGGGSGHEPAHAGFVGSGMLSAAVCGNVFASPNASQVRRGIELVDNAKGTLIIVKNYTGDILNFGLAKETYLAAHPDKIDKLKFVVVADDVSVGKSQGSLVGRRGLAGTILVYKIAGALAQQGGSLDEVYAMAQWVSSRIGTIGVGLEHCHVPGTESSESRLTSTELEIGMGIHNEHGYTRVSPIPDLRSLVDQLLALITSTNDPERSFLPFSNDGSDDVVLLVNNLGGVSELEMGAIANTAAQLLAEKKIKIHRILTGSFMTSLNMPGFSLTLLLLPRVSESGAPQLSEVVSLLDERAETSGWRWSSAELPSVVPAAVPPASSEALSEVPDSLPKITAEDPVAFAQAVIRSCQALISAEPEITRMDTIAGDGDCGLTLKVGSEAVLEDCRSGKIGGRDIVGTALAIARVAETKMGGTSGALYSIFFSSLAQGFIATIGTGSRYTEDHRLATHELWQAALRYALDRLYTYTRARPPSRTLVDPLSAFVKSFSAGNLASAVKVAAEAAEDTKNLAAKAGRSAYIEGDALKKEQIPDPGAWGVKVLLEALVNDV